MTSCVGAGEHGARTSPARRGPKRRRDGLHSSSERGEWAVSLVSGTLTVPLMSTRNPDINLVIISPRSGCKMWTFDPGVTRAALPCVDFEPGSLSPGFALP